MQYPERFSNLPAYVFPRLRSLLAPYAPGGAECRMTIGEPQHPMPDFVGEVLGAHLSGFNRYPPNDGTPSLRHAIRDWIKRRYGVALDDETQIKPLNGTREGLFNAALALGPEEKNGKEARILIPNPFYQVYAMAARAIHTQAVFLDAEADTGFLPDLDAIPQATLAQTTIFYLCSPSNPQGAVADRAYWRQLLALAEAHDFLIFADECYAEIYRNAPPVGALEVAEEMGLQGRVIVFHSLSKRSNLPGLRSGFAAGAAQHIGKMKELASYAGAPLPLPLQHVAERAWADEAHVAANRALYQAKYDLADRIFGTVPGYYPPQAGFFLWLPVEDDEAAAIKLWRETGVQVLPGSYLSRPSTGLTQAYIRVALVADYHTTEAGLMALHACLYGEH